MSNTAGIYIKIGDDSVGDYSTKYVGQIDNYDNADWMQLKEWVVNSIEGLTTYHEERQQTRQDREDREVTQEEAFQALEATSPWPTLEAFTSVAWRKFRGEVEAMNDGQGP